MKKRFQSLVAGIIIGGILTSGLTFARQAVETAELIYNNIKIQIEGEEITPLDANGNAVEPFIVNGTTYLPVRAISNALGKYVTWDASSNTVKIYSEKPDDTQVLKKDPSLGWIYYEYFTDNYDYKGQSFEYLYKMPQFNIDTQDAKMVNEAIAEHIESIIYYDLKSATHTGYVIGFKHFPYENDDIVSIVIAVQNPDGEDYSYKAYTMDIKNGTFIDNKTMIERAGCQEEEFLEKLKTLMLDKFKELYGKYENSPYEWPSKAYKSAYNYTITELFDELNAEIPMYVGEDRHLYAIPKIGAIAGPAYYEHIIDTGLIVR